MAFITPTRLPSSLDISSASSLSSSSSFDKATTTLPHHHHRNQRYRYGHEQHHQHQQQYQCPSPATVRFTVRAVAGDSGRVSVSRHRRLYDFYSATAAYAKSTQSATSTSLRPAVPSIVAAAKNFEGLSEPLAPIVDPTSAEYMDMDMNRIRTKLILRAQQRQQANAAAQALQHELWIESLPSPETLAPPAEPEPEPEPEPESEPEPEPEPVVVEEVTQETEAVVSTPTIPPPPLATEQTLEANIETVIADTPKAEPKTKVEPISGGSLDTVIDLYGPQSTKTSSDIPPSSPKEAVQDTVSELYSPPVEDTVSELHSPPVEDTVSELYSPPIVSSPERELEEIQEAEDELKPLGQALLDVITEGMPTPTPIDKSQVVDLVSSGKIKNLTVMKLKRLLSEHNLKTSGRKAELIARLTSFAYSNN